MAQAAEDEAMPALPKILLWLYAKGRATRDRSGENRGAVPVSVLYPECLRQAFDDFAYGGPDEPAAARPAIRGLGPERPGEGRWPADVWQDVLCDSALVGAHRVTGACLAEYHSAPSLVDCWTHAQDGIRSYWQATSHRDWPLVFFKVLRITIFAEPVQVIARGNQAIPKAVFFQLSPFATDRLFNEERLEDGTVMNSKLDVWCTDLGLDRASLLDHTGVFRTAYTLPLSFMFALRHQMWDIQGFPVRAGRCAAGLGIVYAKGLYEHLDLDQLCARNDAERAGLLASDDNSIMEVKFMQLLIRSMRDCYGWQIGDGPPVGQRDPGAIEAAIHNLVRRCDLSACGAIGRHKRAYSFVRIINCLVAGGYLKNAADLKALLAHSINSSVHDPNFKKFLIDGLQDAKAVPSRTTCYRHRLTLHIAYVTTQQPFHSGLLNSPGGAIVFSTVDSSPQGGWDWVMSGHRALSAEDVVACFRCATVILNRTADEETLAEASATLKQKLRIVQGSPTAVGSGKSSLRRKVHALLHAARLVSDSWQSAVALMNSTVSFTGDMGVESLLAGFVEDARSLMGDWIVEADADEGRDPDDAPELGPDSDVEFAIEPEPRVVDDGDDGDGDIAFDMCEEVGGLAEAGEQPHPCEAARQAISRDRSADPWILDFRGSLFVAGVLHIIHNAAEDLLDRLQNSVAFLLSLKHICRLLSRQWSRARFAETCLVDALAICRDDFEHFSASVYDGRWGSVTHAIGQLLRVQRPLCLACNPRLYGNAVAADRGDGQGVKLEHVTDGIRSQKFWAMAKVLDVLGETLEQLQKWAESCPCHWRDRGLRGPGRHLLRHNNAAVARAPFVNCHLKTLRAPCMAAGEHLRLLDRLN